MADGKSTAERWLEAGLFGSRWLVAPFYVGLVGSLVLLLAVFVRELVTELSHLTELQPRHGILAALSLIDLSLAANLVLIVIFSGYENFIARFDTVATESRPAWLGTIDFAGLKRKLIASIVAISAVALLRAFMEAAEEGGVLDTARMRWLIAGHLTFVISGLLMAMTDWFASRAGRH